MTRASRSRNGTTYVYVLLLLSISRLAARTTPHRDTPADHRRTMVERRCSPTVSVTLTGTRYSCSAYSLVVHRYTGYRFTLIDASSFAIAFRSTVRSTDPRHRRTSHATSHIATLPAPLPPHHSSHTAHERTPASPQLCRYIELYLQITVRSRLGYVSAAGNACGCAGAPEAPTELLCFTFQYSCIDSRRYQINIK